MINRTALCCAMLLAFSTPAWAAEKHHPKKPAKASAKKAAAKSKAPAAKAVNKAAAKSATKIVTARAAATHPHARLVKTALQPHPAPALHGPREVLACREGTEDRHARIAVVLVGGRTESFAYYSKWKPRTCSIYLQRGRDASKWSDSGTVTNVNAERGVFMIEHGRSEYRFVFRDVDRERYCGMDGTINGTLTIRRGSERCEIAGIMEEGVPLGQAVAHAEAAAAAEPLPTTAPPAKASSPREATASADEHSFFKRLAQRMHREPSAAWHHSVIVGD